MINNALLGFVNSILGNGKITSKGNYSYFCPFCNHHKKKLEINFDENSPFYQDYHCWVCGKKGKFLTFIPKKYSLSNVQINQFNILTKKSKNVSINNKVDKKVELPKEFRSLVNVKKYEIEGLQALKYLKNRSININHIIKYNIGYCPYGEYSGRIIIPSYNKNNELNFFISRNYLTDYVKYKNPPVPNNNIIFFESFINWKLPVLLCEGVFDAISLRQNAIPLLGKEIKESLWLEIINHKPEIYIILDQDARINANDICYKLLNYNIKTYLVELDNKDPNETKYDILLDKIQSADVFTIQQYLKNKI